MTTLNLAESAFIDAVVASMKTQAKIIPLAQELNAQMEKVATANEAVLRSNGITDESPLDETLEQQRHYVDLAIERSGMGEDEPVVRGMRSQLKKMEAGVRQMLAEEDAMLGKIKGPQL